MSGRDGPAKANYNCQHVWELSSPTPHRIWVRCQHCGLAMLTAPPIDRIPMQIVGLVMPHGVRLPATELDRARREVGQMIAKLAL